MNGMDSCDFFQCKETHHFELFILVVADKGIYISGCDMIECRQGLTDNDTGESRSILVQHPDTCKGLKIMIRVIKSQNNGLTVCLEPALNSCRLVYRLIPSCWGALVDKEDSISGGMPSR